MSGTLGIILMVFLFVFSCAKKEDGQTTKIFEGIKEQIEIEETGESTTFESKTLKSDKDFKIAALLPIDGVHHPLAQEGLAAIDLAKLNFGEKLQIEIFDTKENTDEIDIIAEQIQDKDFDAVVGPIFGFEATRLAKNRDLPPIVSLSNDKALVEEGVIPFGINKEDKIIDSVNFFIESGKTNFVTLFPNSTSGSKLYSMVKKAVEGASGKIMRAEFYDDTGVSSAIKYVYRAFSGFKQVSYISKETGETITEKQFNILKEKNQTPKESEEAVDIENNYDQEIKKADVFFIFGGAHLNQIMKVIKSPSNLAKLDGVDIFFVDVDPAKDDLTPCEGGFIYLDSGPEMKEFYAAMNKKLGRMPTMLSAVLYDAIAYLVYVNNQTSGKLSIYDLKKKAAGFEGLNGLFFITDSGHVKRRGVVKMVDSNMLNIESIKHNDISDDSNQRHKINKL